ncbi:MAG TPA: FG-GAP-like repeat-containing protein [Usitatibacter sp.]|nr:FG-GAP-like repeat-containing protein [Usitatibacter sp.]
MRNPTFAFFLLLLGAGSSHAALDTGMVQKALAGRGDRFIEVPQSRGGASYVASSSAQTMRFGESGIEIRPRYASSASLQYEFAGARQVAPVASSPASGILYHWFVGSRDNWAHDLKSYSQIAYRGLWSGIDATYSGDAHGLKYHFDVAPGVDPATIRMTVRGASDARIAADGAVEWTVAGKVVRDEPPVAYQGAPGHEAIVPAAFKLEAIDAATWSVSIATTGYDKAKSLTVDPAWTAFAGLVGGSSADQVYSVALDAQGNTYACGITASLNLPTTAAFDTSADGDSDAFVVKFSPLGVPAFVTYFGGGGYDACTGLAVHSDGTIYVTGATQSTNFPFLGSSSDSRLARTKAGTDRDAFVAKFTAAGNALVFSGVLGGAGDDQSNAIALDGSGNAYIAGYSTSAAGFPAVAGPSLAFNGTMDAFVARIAADGTTVPFAGFIGGNGDIGAAHAIAVGGDGSVYVAGETDSTTGLPVATAMRTLTSAGGDAFVAKIGTSGSLAWFALLSGTSASSTGIDRALALAIDPADGNLLVAGETDSDNFPANDAGARLVAGGAQSTRSGGMDGFLVRMNTSGTAVLAATYLGGTAFDTAEGVAADGQGGVYVTGTVAASSSSFPTAASNGLSTARLGAQDAFLAKLTGSSLALAYSGFLGSNVSGSSVDDAMHAITASQEAQSVLALGGATSADASGFTASNGTALVTGGTNGVAIRIAPYHTPLSMAAISGTPQHATINSGFGLALKVRVIDSDGAGIPGISVTFTAPGSGASAALVPSIPVTTDASGIAQVSATANGTAGGPYTVSASANATGILLSGSFSLTNDKLPQSISFGTLPDRTYGDAPFTISATADSGLAVSFSAGPGGVCSVLGNSVTIVGPGTCTVQADQAGDATHAAAAPVQQPFNVAKASQTISFPQVAAQAFTPGGTFAANATSSASLTVTLSTTSSACTTLGGSSVRMNSTGTCTITASQSGNANFAAATSVTQDIGIHAAPGHTADFDATGKGDLLWQNADGRAAVWLMNGLAVTSSAEILPAGTGFHVVQVADLDGDGKADLVWAHPDGRVVVWIMDGFAHGAKATLVPAASGWSVVAAADLDGDGKADLVWQHTDGSIAVWTMNGVTRVDGATILGAGTGWSVTRTADFDGDGKADLLLTNTDGRVAIWLMNGTTVRSSTEIMPGGTGWSVVATPDLNGDGRADIVWHNTDGSVNAWLMNGAATLSTAPILAAGTPWSVSLTGDFDGDGMDDILFTETNGSAAIYLMNGTVPKQTTQILNAGGGWAPAKLRDLDGDGKLDIVWQNADGRVAAWLMNGATMVSGGDLIGTGTGWSISPAAP